MAISRERSLLKLIVIIPVLIVILASAMFITISFSISKDTLAHEIEILNHIESLKLDINISKYSENSKNNEIVNINLMIITAFVVFAILLVSMLMFATIFKRILKQYKEDINEFNDQKAKRSLILNQKSKLSSMEDMISSIAHQWRQPLNSLGISVQNLEFDYEDGLIKDDYLKEYVKTNMTLINFMSHTIDDFRNLLKKDKIKTKFSIKNEIVRIVKMQESRFEIAKIKIDIQGDDFLIDGFKNEFQQVILNLLNNAKDILIKETRENREINITLNKFKNLINIEDNGGGIKEEIIEKIFEPYFTTKSDGTGIGLYMSKVIIENNMGGYLWVLNTSKGAKFTISFGDEQ